jgi:hypothetical protein
MPVWLSWGGSRLRRQVCLPRTADHPRSSRTTIYPHCSITERRQARNYVADAPDQVRGFAPRASASAASRRHCAATSRIVSRRSEWFSPSDSAIRSHVSACARYSSADMGMIGSYRGSAKWAAFTGSCSSRRSIWTASATQLLAMPRIIVSDRIVTLVRDSRVHSAACRLHS